MGNTNNIFYGVAMVVGAVIFLISGIGALKNSFYILSPEADILIAFVLGLGGVAYIFNNK